MKRILVSLCMILGLVLYVNCKEKKKEDKSLQAGYVTFAKGDNKLISKDGKEQKITVSSGGPIIFLWVQKMEGCRREILMTRWNWNPVICRRCLMQNNRMALQRDN